MQTSLNFFVRICKAAPSFLPAVLLAVPLYAQTHVWEGVHGDGSDWFDAANWAPQQVPGNGADVEIAAGANVLLTNATASLADVAMTGGTLTFSNWPTALIAANVGIAGGILTLPPAFTDSDMSNRVVIVCSTFTLGADAVIDVGGKGYRASPASAGTAYGPGAPPVSAHYGGGGGHGGAGGPGDSAGATGGPVYGVTNAPLAPGSGGGGSGGSIFISCSRFGGSAEATLQANGGNSGVLVANAHAGSGGGGRIAVAIGMTAPDIQALIDENPVANLFYYDRYGSYTGTVSVIGGSPALDSIGDNSTDNHKGQDGSFRFITASSETICWLLVQGDPQDLAHAAPYDNGLHAGFPVGVWVTNNAVSPFDEGHGVRRIALGWNVTNQTGSIVAEGNGSEAVFQMSTNLLLRYFWTNAYQLSVMTANGAEGTVNAEAISGFYTSGVTVASITATPQAGYQFNRWFGQDVPEGQESVNPLTVVMDRPRTLIAAFQKDGGELRTWSGTLFLMR